MSWSVSGYGDMFSYTGVNVRADGFETKQISNEIMRQTFGALVFTRLLTESRDAFGVGKGGTFTIPIFKNWGMPTSVSPLTAGTTIGIGTQTTDSVSMMMYEYGTGVGYEKLANWWTDIDCQAELVTTLKNHVARMINYLHFTVFNETPWELQVPAAGSYSTILGSNHAGMNFATAGELGVGGIAFLYDSFKTRLITPINDRGLYGIVGNCETFRNLKSGSVFQNQQLYNQFQGERYQILGEFNGFVFIETEEQLTKGTAFAFGANVGGYGFGMPPTTYFYPDFGQDANRLQVWKTLFYDGQGPTWRTKGTNCVIIRSRTAAFAYSGLG